MPREVQENKIQEVIMSDFNIRQYKDTDYEAVRAMFADGMMEHVPTTFWFLLNNPRIYLLLLCVFLILLICSKSFLFCILAVALLLAVGWHFLNAEFQQFIQQCLREDLLDISKSYLGGDGSCFWVAESGGDVVGMVGAQYLRNPDEQPKIELKRMSVGKCHRKRGIAKVLCRTVLSFARQRGCSAVILQTSQVQFAAQKLYESLGFRKLHEFRLPSYFAMLTNFTIFHYRYDIPA
ncbi:probable N-acetyltransferase camello isoform X2 [Rhinatrema bivittatum]|uniref:probable N-acetyltransferase camello isoform X2 n=1 Tax=Rhinatrema bivittatum TaxID=194408 RepID=UPI001127BF82|nr:probable N-acetyltransferase camello isoform X2 [Rhinatrema bivittatum]